MSDELSPFLTPIDMGAQPDHDFIMNTLVPHFESTASKLKASLSTDTKACEELQQQLAQTISDNKYTPNFLNRAIYRKWRMITPEYERHHFALLRTRISLVSGRLSLLQQLLNLTEYLAHHPRYVYINVHYATQPLTLLELHCLHDMLSRDYAYRQSLTLLESQLQLLSAPFDSVDKNVRLVRDLIDVNVRKTDPETGYLPETEEHAIFVEFLLSATSPYKVRLRGILAKGDFLTVHDELMRAIAAYVGLLAGHPKHVDVLKQMCARFLFDRFVMTERSSPSGKLEQWLKLKADATVRELALGEAILAEDANDKTALQVLAEKKVVAEAAQELLACHFIANPIDLLFNIRKIDDQLANLVAEEKAQDVAVVKNFDNLVAAWKLLFVAAQVPDPQRIFEFIRGWKKLDFIPNDLMSAYKVPCFVLKALLTDALRE